MKRNYYFGSYIMYYQSSINLNAFYFIFYGEEFQGDIRPLALYIEIISLLSKVLKLSSKLTSRVCEARVQ